MLGRDRERRGRTLHDRSDQHELPFGPPARDGVDQLDIDPLVDHPVVSQPRMRDPGLVGRLRETAPGAHEVGVVDAARKRMDARVRRTLRAIQALAAGEHDVGPLHQPLLTRADLGRGVVEERELVHAVVHGCDRAQPLDHGERHRGVHPEDVAVEPPFAKQTVQQVALRGLGGGRMRAVRQHRDGDRDPVLSLRHAQLSRAVVETMLLHEEDAMPASPPGHQVLRALIREVPAQVGEADDIEVVAPLPGACSIGHGISIRPKGPGADAAATRPGRLNAQPAP
jgi:hypothetical protein